MITVVIPRKRKKVPRLKKNGLVWEVLYKPTLYEFNDEYRLNTMLLQDLAEELNRKEQAAWRRIVRNQCCSTTPKLEKKS